MSRPNRGKIHPSERSHYAKLRINLRLQIFQSSYCFCYDFIPPPCRLYVVKGPGLSRFIPTAESGITRGGVGPLFIVKDRKTKSRSLLPRRDTVVPPRYRERPFRRRGFNFASPLFESCIALFSPRLTTASFSLSFSLFLPLPPPPFPLINIYTDN